MKRNIIKIDEDKCNGCGLCVLDCHEGAIKIINGKARLVSESYCDGLGACIGACPVGAITIEQREAETYDEKRMPKKEGGHEHKGCPGARTLDLGRKPGGTVPSAAGACASRLGNWPVQLKLVNSRASFFKDAELVVSADCVPFARLDFHERFLAGKVLVIFCPKLDSDIDEYVEKLSDIVKGNNIKSVTMVHMEVPCCHSLVSVVQEAVMRSGKNVLMKEYTISLEGEIV